jgi:hypothetical protein
MDAYPQEVTTTERCQAREYFWSAAGVEPRPCPERAVARWTDGLLYCEWHIGCLGWVRTAPSDRQQQGEEEGRDATV